MQFIQIRRNISCSLEVFFDKTLGFVSLYTPSVLLQYFSYDMRREQKKLSYLK